MKNKENNHKASQAYLENNLQQLEEIISGMMNDEVANIEATLTSYEKGIHLIRESKGILGKVQQEIDTLTNADPIPFSSSIEEKDIGIVSLEKNIAELKHIIATMENERNIESELVEFKRGIQLVWQSQAMLRNAEQRVRVLTEKNRDLALENFSSDEANL